MLVHGELLHGCDDSSQKLACPLFVWSDILLVPIINRSHLSWVTLVLCCTHATLVSVQRLLAFSEEQLHDLMLLRRLYVTRRGLHAMERRALVSQAPINHHQIPLPNDNLTQLSGLASQLKKNAEDDYRVYHRVACASRRGVRA